MVQLGNSWAVIEDRNLKIVAAKNKKDAYEKVYGKRKISALVCAGSCITRFRGV